MTKMSREAWDAAQIERAVYFTAFLFNGRGDRRKVRCETLEEARAAVAELNTQATNGRAALVYAVTPEGWSIHVENV